MLRHVDVPHGRDVAPVVLEVPDRGRIDAAAGDDLTGSTQRRNRVRDCRAGIRRVLIAAVPLPAARRDRIDATGLSLQLGDNRRRIVVRMGRIRRQSDPPDVLAAASLHVNGHTARHTDAQLLQHGRVDARGRTRCLHLATRIRNAIRMQFHVAAGLDQRRRVVDHRRIRIIAARILAAGQYDLAHAENGSRRHRVGGRRIVPVFDVARENLERAVGIRRADQRGRTNVRNSICCIERRAGADERTCIEQIR
ncbi:hypothetical protein FEP14_03627 [Burkholderia multivorans]|nr:hypothetical protein [Burkholderia multivorans]